jgi:hypothetical protein
VRLLADYDIVAGVAGLAGCLLPPRTAARASLGLGGSSRVLAFSTEVRPTAVYEQLVGRPETSCHDGLLSVIMRK